MRFKLFLHRLFNLHQVEYYTDNLHFTRGVCCCGWEGDVDSTGRFY
ncbi:hypothetical protein SEA_SAKAI_89 [Arthrobacter phage Sakai]|jgi:hypothetical protein|nr:hypothetical protein SEA_GORPY_90 [Arthrobacter phage Gorpy]UVK62036.1 hypothetical protein SEA_SAKAI_89 [Arthrobacter phage Sakai]